MTFRNDELRVETKREPACCVEDVELAAAHSRAGIQSDLSEHDHPSACHVLARVVADTLDDRRRARIAHREPLACAPAREQLSAGRSVERRVAEENRVARIVARRQHDDPTPTHPLADVIVRLADHFELHAGGQEGAEALPGRAFEPRSHAAGRRAGPKSPADLDTESGTDRSVPVPDRIRQFDETIFLEGGGGVAGQSLPELAAVSA